MQYNKGLAFTQAERQALRIEGLLPPAFLTQDVQVARIEKAYRKYDVPINRYRYLLQIADTNEKLFYRVLQKNVEELLPVVYTPTVGQACMEFGSLFTKPRGMYISLKDRGNVRNIINNWPARTVEAIVVTDGSRILGLGDLGAYGMGIPIGKLMLYTACAGVAPEKCLPVLIDVGTDNKNHHDDPMYTGIKEPRDRSMAYDYLIEEFITAAVARWGEKCLIQFEDFSNNNASRLLTTYKNRILTFNDDIQGTASVVLAGVIAAYPLTRKTLRNHTFLFYGAGSAGIGIANLIAYAISSEENISIAMARERIWLVDSRGLIVKDRPSGGLNAEKSLYAHEHKHLDNDLATIVEAIKPSCLFGVTAQPNSFTEEVCTKMASFNKRPLIFALSNPTSKSECTAKDAYTWTNGTCIFASGSPFDPVTLENPTRLFCPGQGNNSFIFPGLAKGVLTFGATRINDHMFYVAAKTLAQCVKEKDLQVGKVYPSLSDIRQVSATIAVAVGEYCYKSQLATLYPKPMDMLQYVIDNMYSTDYLSYVY